MYSEINQLLENGISQDLLMLHGTSIESVFELAKTGKLPTGVPCIGDEHFRDPHKDRLYFYPISSPLVGMEYESIVRSDKPRAMAGAKHSALSNAFTGYYANEVNCKAPSTYHLIKDLESGSMGWEDFKKGLKKDGIKMEVERIESIYDEAKKRKGSIIEANENVLKLEHGFIDHDIIFVFCPQGLDIQYIKGIELQGPIEKKMMQKFLGGKLEYNGFRTH